MNPMTALVGNNTIEIHLYEDWAVHLGHVLATQGYNIEPSNNPSDIALQYFNVQQKRISISPRQFIYAKEFSCPDEHLKGLEALQIKSERGEDLLSYQSRLTLKADFYAGILFDWGIQHLHLGTSVDSNGFIQRTQKVLFCIIGEHEIFCIDVRSHGSGYPEVWREKDLLEIVNSNWSEVFNYCKLANVTNVFPRLETPQEIMDMRKAGLTVAISLSDGSILLPPGGGHATAGNSISASMKHNAQANHLGRLMRKIRDDASSIIEAINANTNYRGSIFEFRLGVLDGTWIVFEKHSQTQHWQLDGLAPFDNQ
jgi:hypothetical protein